MLWYFDVMPACSETSVACALLNDSQSVVRLHQGQCTTRSVHPPRCLGVSHHSMCDPRRESVIMGVLLLEVRAELVVVCAGERAVVGVAGGTLHEQMDKARVQW